MAIDTNVAIYAVQNDPVYAPLLRPLWRALRNGSLTIVYSELLLCEALAGAFRNDDLQQAAAYETFLASPGFEGKLVSRAVLVHAARLRAETRLRTPDAIHAATALEMGCALFLTNDPHFRRIPELPATVLDDIRRA